MEASGRALGCPGGALGGSGGALEELWEALYIDKLPINRPSGRYVIIVGAGMALTGQITQVYLIYLALRLILYPTRTGLRKG